jgi:hypothetical protein
MIAAGSGIPNSNSTREYPGACRAGFRPRWPSSVLVLLSCLLVQACGNSDSRAPVRADVPAPRSVPTKSDSLFARSKNDSDVTGSVDSFADRYSAVESFGSKSARATTSGPQRSYRVASLSPEIPYAPSIINKQPQTRLIGFENSAFPYPGGGKGGHYSDNRVLVHVPEGFDVRKPGVIVVFFHGHRATLERDVRDRQLLPAQITESGVNAVLLAPQLAYDAADSSAGKFYERGGLKRFVDEGTQHLARLYGDPSAAAAFSKMPVVVVGYSGGFMPTAWSLKVGGLGKRIIGVVLLDAVYGQLDTFASWIVKNRKGFFVSSYTAHNKHRDDELEKMVRDHGIAVTHELNGPLRPGSVAFVATRDGINHRDYVTRAWAQHPITDILDKIAQR